MEAFKNPLLSTESSEIITRLMNSLFSDTPGLTKFQLRYTKSICVTSPLVTLEFSIRSKRYTNEPASAQAVSVIDDILGACYARSKPDATVNEILVTEGFSSSCGPLSDKSVLLRDNKGQN